MDQPEGEFQAWRFEDPDCYEEDLLCDRKLGFYALADNRAEILRDIIALANSARRLGRPAHLLFGINDSGTVVGLEDSLQRFRTGNQTQVQVQEEVRHRIHQLVGEYVKPHPPTWELKFGRVHDKEVAYLLIHPEATHDVFYVGKTFSHHGKVLLTEGDCWIRDGESKQKIDKAVFGNHQTRYCYADVPYLLPSKWHRYFDECVNSEILNEAATITGYQELLSTAGSTLSDVVREFAAGDSQILILSGAAGSGKTVFLRRWAFSLAGASLDAVKQIRAREEFVSPPGSIPVYLSLRGETLSFADKLAARLLDNINRNGRFWDNPPVRADQLFHRPNLHWLFLLDGLDEIRSFDGQQQFLSGFLAK